MFSYATISRNSGSKKTVTEFSKTLDSDIQSLKADEYPNGFVTMVGVDVEQYRQRVRSIKKTLTIPGWLNDAAIEQHINFSQVLQEALKARLGL